MASPFPFTAGQVLTAAQLNSIAEASYSYTPVLQGSVTDPTLGLGSAQVGRYQQVNKTVFVSGHIYAGTGATGGSGNYSITLPLAASEAETNLGFVFYYNNATGVAFPLIGYTSGSDAGLFAVDGVNTINVTPTNPFTFGNGSQLRFNFVYEVA